MVDASYSDVTYQLHSLAVQGNIKVVFFFHAVAAFERMISAFGCAKTCLAWKAGYGCDLTSFHPLPCCLPRPYALIVLSEVLSSFIYQSGFSRP